MEWLNYNQEYNELTSKLEQTEVLPEYESLKNMLWEVFSSLEKYTFSWLDSLESVNRLENISRLLQQIIIDGVMDDNDKQQLNELNWLLSGLKYWTIENNNQEKRDIRKIEQSYLQIRQEVIDSWDISQEKMQDLLAMSVDKQWQIISSWERNWWILIQNIFYWEWVTDEFKNKFANFLLDNIKYIDNTNNVDAQNHNSILDHIDMFRPLEFKKVSNQSTEYLPSQNNNVFETKMNLPSYLISILSSPEQKVLVEKIDDVKMKKVLKQIFGTEKVNGEYNFILNPSQSLDKKESNFPGKAIKWEAFLNPKACENVLWVLINHLWEEKVLKLFPDWIEQKWYNDMTIINELIHTNLSELFEFHISTNTERMDKELDVGSMDSGIDWYTIPNSNTLNEFLSDVGSFSINKLYFLHLIANINWNWLEIKDWKLHVASSESPLYNWYIYSFNFFTDKLNQIIEQKWIKLKDWSEFWKNEIIDILTPEDLSKIQQAYLKQWENLINVVKTKLKKPQD